jgi:hypothetical protein
MVLLKHKDNFTFIFTLCIYEDVSKSFRTDSVMKYVLTFGIIHLEATQRVMVWQNSLDWLTK